MDRWEARDKLYTFASDRWEEASLEFLEKTSPIRFEGVFNQAEPPTTEYWAHIDVQTVSEEQETLRDEVRRFKTEGQIIVALRAPIRANRSQIILDQLAEYMRNAFREYQSENIEFTRSRIWDNMSPTADWLRANIISTFAYRQFI